MKTLYKHVAEAAGRYCFYVSKTHMSLTVYIQRVDIWRLTKARATTFVVYERKPLPSLSNNTC